MAADTTLYRRASHNHTIEFDLGTARNWYLADVDGYGMDTGNFPVPADPDAPTIVQAFDGVTAVGRISGSVQAGGFATELTIPRYLADFADWFGCTILARGTLGGVPGIPGAGGDELGRVVLFRGYMQTVTGTRAYGMQTTRFPVASSSAFLRNSSFSRGLDWYAGSASHPAPTTAHDIIRHLLLAHTNIYPRSNYGIYIPDHALDGFSLNAGSVMSMIQGLLDNFTGGEGWLMCRRNDDIYLGCHPNLDRDGLHPSLNDPIIDFDDGLVDQYDIAETPPRAVAAVTVVGTHSDQTTHVATYYGPNGAGSRVRRDIRTDDDAVVDWLAARLHAHLNRRFQAVKLTVSGLPGITVDLGDVVTVTTDIPQRNIHWSGKKFAVIAIEYASDTQKNTLTSTLTLDECLP